MPRHAGDRKRVERPRRLAKRLMPLVTGTPLARADEAYLLALFDDLVEEGMAAESASRAVSLVRRLAIHWAEDLGIEPLVDPDISRRGASRRRSGGRRPRPTPTPTAVAELIGRASPPLACFVALVAGGALSEQEALAVRTSDLARLPALPIREVDGGHKRDAALAGWASAILEANAHHLGRPGSPFAFPHRLDPARPRLSFNRSLRAAGGPTSSGLRRIGQLVQRSGGLPREAVRGSWRAVDYGRGRPPWWQSYTRLQGAWAVLVHPPVALPQSMKLPRRTGAKNALEPDIGAGLRASTVSVPAAAAIDAAPPRPRFDCLEAGTPGGAPPDRTRASTGATPRSAPDHHSSGAPDPARRANAPAPRFAVRRRRGQAFLDEPATSDKDPELESLLGRLDHLEPELESLLGRLDHLERSDQRREQAVASLKREVRRLPSQRTVARGSDGGAFLAGAATGAALTLLLSRPDLLQHLGIDEDDVRRLLSTQEEAEEPPVLEAPMYSYFAGPSPFGQ